MSVISNKEKTRFGSSLQHGQAHNRDHSSWSRRDFLSGIGLALGGSLLLGNTPVSALTNARLASYLHNAPSDRILLLIQLSGGNDGLNTVIPFNNDIYYNSRPNLAIPGNTLQAYKLDEDLALHPNMGQLHNRFNDGQLAVMQSVGYPNPNLSHFRSTDIWQTGSSAEEALSTGWIGRYLAEAVPDFSDNPPDYPLAVQIGGLSSLMFQGPTGNMGMTMANADFFARLVEQGTLFTLDAVPDTTYGSEMAFLRTIANDSFIYASSIQEASNSGSNEVEYPQNNPLSASLSVVAQLIKGNLGSRIYHVILSGFDTHANQANVHGRLLQNLSEGIDLFLQDIEAAGMQKEVLTMTFSEFGRRVGQNGSFGTDHGTAAPLFLAGEGVVAGLHGATPDLVDLDATGNLKFDIDFRNVYANILVDWFGLSPAVVETILQGYSYNPLNVIRESANPVSIEEDSVPGSFVLHQNYPNPFNPSTTLSFTLPSEKHVLLSVYNLEGRLVSQLLDQRISAGEQTVSFDASNLPSGTYIYRLEAEGVVQTRKMVLLR